MVIDIIFVIATLYGFYLGFSKGIIGTVFTVLSLLLGLMAAFKFAPAMTNFLETTFNSQNPLMFIAGFLLSFVLTMILIRTIARALEGLLETANINIINQILGGMLLGAVLILIYSVLLWFGDQAHLIDKKTKDESLTYKYLEPYPAQVKSVAIKFKPVFEEFWYHTLDAMDKLERMSVEKEESDSNFYDIPEEEEEDNSN